MKNEVILEGTVVRIKIPFNDEFIFAIIDSDDLEKCSNYVWRSTARGRYRISIRAFMQNKYVLLSNFILNDGYKARPAVHINDDVLDFRKSNLRRAQPVRIDGETSYMLIFSKNDIVEIKFDTDDLPLIQKYTWSVRKIFLKKNSPYFSIRGGYHNKTISMAALLMNPSKGEIVDHIDRDPTNNKKTNLRSICQAANQQNRKTDFAVQKTRNGKYMLMANIGSYDDLEQAQKIEVAFRTYHRKYSPKE